MRPLCTKIWFSGECVYTISGTPIEFGAGRYCTGWIRMIRTAIVEDDAEEMQLIKSYLERCSKEQCFNCVIDLYTDGDEIVDGVLDTALVKAFKVPAGVPVEVYATTLHFAPCSVSGKEFRMGVALPRGTNEPLDFVPEKTGENQLLLQRNKWLLAHKDSGLDKDGAWIGLVGENIEIR